MITADLRGGGVTVTDIDPACLEATPIYFGAHALLPDGFDGASAAWHPTVDEALATLQSPDSTSDARLRAIVILGHTPSAAALGTLQRYAESGSELAALAMLAADECAMWMGPMREPASAAH